MEVEMNKHEEDTRLEEIKEETKEEASNQSTDESKVLIQNCRAAKEQYTKMFVELTQTKNQLLRTSELNDLKPLVSRFYSLTKQMMDAKMTMISTRRSIQTLKIEQIKTLMRQIRLNKNNTKK